MTLAVGFMTQQYRVLTLVIVDDFSSWVYDVTIPCVDFSNC